jgi:hypothetical protein
MGVGGLGRNLESGGFEVSLQNDRFCKGASINLVT